MWRSLACLLVESIACGVVTADVMEALWMCRVKQLTPHQVYIYISGIIICYSLRPLKMKGNGFTFSSLFFRGDPS